MQVFVKLLLLYVPIVLCSNFFITISPELPCPMENVQECKTLEQFASISTSDQYSGGNTLLTLELLPGSHVLNSNLTIRNISLLNISSASQENVNISCKGEKVGFILINVSEVLFTHINFYECGSRLEVPVVKVVSSNVCVTKCEFRKSNGVVIYGYASYINVTGSLYSENKYDIFLIKESKSYFNSCKFDHNCVSSKSKFIFNVMNTSITLYKSEVSKNAVCSIVIRASNCTVRLESSTINKNNVSRNIIRATKCNVQFDNAKIERNIAYLGPAIYFSESLLQTYGIITVENNVVNIISRIFTIKGQSVNITGVLIFDGNIGSFFISKSKILFHGMVKFQNSNTSIQPPLSYYRSYYIGSTFTTINSDVIFYESATIFNNYGYSGGIYALWSTVIVRKNINITGNVASKCGGGVYLYSSTFICEAHCNFSSNKVRNEGQGGGIFAINSEVILGCDSANNYCTSKNTMMIFKNNSAHDGGGLYLVESKLSICTKEKSQNCRLFFEYNQANRGEAIYVDDNEHFKTCKIKGYHEEQCFIDAPYQRWNSIQIKILGESYTTIFGGQLNKCSAGELPFSGIDFLEKVYMSNSKYDNHIEQLITSKPVNISLCDEDKVVPSNWGKKRVAIAVKRGASFTVRLAAVDQLEHLVSASIASQLSSKDNGKLKQHQELQMIPGECTNLTFNVLSSANSEELVINLEGQCNNEQAIRITITFDACECPKGFQQGDQENDCQCECDSNILKPYSNFIMACNLSSVTTKGGLWIRYDNQSGFLIHPFCPYHYCLPPLSENVVISLIPPDASASDVQCDNNRTGLLCGKCKHGFSLSLGTSRCLKCRTVQWPWTLMIFIGKIAAGLLIVIIILILNFTVSVGTLNGLIFYANIVATGEDMFLRFPRPNFFTIFIAWLNLDLGFDVCYIKGMDVYSKAWSQFMYPTYLIAAIVLVILMSKCSSRFGKLIGRWNPVATLATLLLLSFTKLLRAIVDALSFTVIKYPTGSQSVVWLSDASVNYFSSKHIPLGLAAIVVTIIGLAYTIILFSWQWLQKAPNKWIFRWIRNTKLNLFMEANLAPYKPRYRFWTGLLLFVRIALYFGIATNKSHDHPTTAVIIGMITACLLMLRTFFGVEIYRKRFVGYLALSYHCNLLALSIGTLFCDNGDKCQETATKMSVSVTFILFILTLFYHIFCAVIESKHFTKIKQKMKTRSFDQSDSCSYRNILESEMKEPAFAGTPTSTEVSLSHDESNVEEDCFTSNEFEISKRKSKVKRISYSNRLRESLLQD